MTRIVTLALLPILLASCGRQEDRSESARQALKAVDELRAGVDEYEALGTRAMELQKKLLWEKNASQPATDAEKAEFEKIRPRLAEIKTRVSKVMSNLLPDLTVRIGEAPKDAGLLDARSRYHETVGDNEEALKDLDAGLALAPKDAVLRTRRPGLLRKMGRYEESRAACADLLKAEPGQPVALATDGLCLYALNQFPEAIA